MYEDKFNLCSSFNYKLFYHPSQESFISLPNKFKNSKCFFYHENSYDLKTKNKQINFENVPNNVLLLDLYDENPWLEDFIKNSHFKKLNNDRNYWNRNSQFWFRKVVSIVNFINKEHDKEFGIWCDCDVSPIGNLDQKVLDFVSKHDWCCRFRPNGNGSIESGIQFFKLNDKTKGFAAKYLQYFLSQDVFKCESNYADNYVLNSCFEKFGSNLKIGHLNEKESFNVYAYFKHNKGTLQSVRENI